MRTTSLLVDDDVLIDAGTGVGDLSLDALLKIDHIFVTHTHLDHITSIPLLLDTVMGLRAQPVTLHATQEVDRKSTRLNSSHSRRSRMPSSA